jgi:DNA mismatch repair protein MutH
MIRRAPPPSLAALLARARALHGVSLGEIAMALGATIGEDSVATKGKFGTLIECALGAAQNAGKAHDFPELGVELKTLPVDKNGAPLESTYVCTLHVQTAESLRWETSWVRDKLRSVLWVCVFSEPDSWRDRVVTGTHHWVPSEVEAAVLRADFDECVGLITTGQIEALSGRVGEALQVRPKARDGKKSLQLHTEDGEVIATGPKGFYLRPSFTRSLLQRGPAAESCSHLTRGNL